MIKKLLDWKVWLLIIVVIMSIIAINPNPWASGLEVKEVSQGSMAYQQGLRPGEKLLEVNDETINSLEEYNNIVAELNNKEKEISVTTDKGTFKYDITNDIGFNVYNLTVISADKNVPLERNMKILAINDIVIYDMDGFNNITKELIPKKKIVIDTNKGEYAYLTQGPPEITIGEAEKTNLKLGLDLKGGTRALLKPKKSDNSTVTDKEINDLIKVMNERFNTYGLSDLKIKPASDWRQENKYVLVEIAGLTRKEVSDLIEQQGVFQAKIGDNLVFEGGKKDVTFVCRDDGTCSGIRSCKPTDGGNWECVFEFKITLSPEAAKRHGDATRYLDEETSPSGSKVLSETSDLYLDGKLVDQLLISADLKGQQETNILISGPGVGKTKEAAIEDASQNMDKLQTILISGSLPVEVEVVKLDTISPLLGKEAIKNSFLVIILALVAVSIVVSVRYKNKKIIIPMLITGLSEILIILGFAAVFEWNLDLAAIAGIIAAIGTGVDDQIVITDEILTGGAESRYTNWKEKIKRAFFIIMAAYATTVVAMLPLLKAGAGLLMGFALTTIVGVSVGVLITRPAFASMVEKLMNK